MTQRRATGLCLLLLLAGSVSAEPPRSPAPMDPVERGRANLRVFTDEDGLPQNAVASIVIDHEGYLWAATKDGVARYDGRSWTVVDLPKEMRSNWVQTLLVASDGSLWMGTLQGGLAQLDKGQWTSFGTASGLPGNGVYCLVESVLPSGRKVLLAGTDKGLARLEAGRWNRVPIDGLPNVSVASMLETTSGDGRRTLWVGTHGKGIARLQDGVWTVYDERVGLRNVETRCFLETTAIDGQPTLLAGTFRGILRFDGAEWRPFAGPGAGTSHTVHALCEVRLPDGERTLWAGTSSGLDRFERGRWIPAASSFGLPPTSIWSLATSDSAAGTHAVWLGTAGRGLAQARLGGWTSFGERSGLPTSSVYGVQVSGSADGSGTLWLGTIDNGLARLDRSGWTFFETATGFVDSTAWCLYEGPDSDGRAALWAGTNTGGLVRLKDGAWTPYSQKDGLPGIRVHCVAPSTGEGGRPALWVGTAQGLGRLEDGVGRPLPAGLRVPEAHVKAVLETRAPDGSVTVWVGTEDGLVRFADGQTTLLKGETLPSGSVLCLHERRFEQRRTLWVGTRAGIGILDLDAPGATCGQLSRTSIPALPNDTVYRIEEDARGRLYVFTNKGVARLTPRTPTPDDPSRFGVYTFTKADGLPSNECNTGASSVDAAGRVWVGTIAGAAVFDPSREVEDRTPKPLVIQRATLPDRRLPLHPGESLAHDESHVVFEFALLSFFKEGETRYRTRLVGLEEQASAWTSESSRDYISLPPGTYEFLLWGRDAFGNVSGPVAVPFSVRKAPWLTWGAMLIYGLALAGLGYAVSRMRVRTLRRRTRELESRIAERTAQLASTVEELKDSEHRALEASRAKSTFLASMSHELRTPLNAILGFVQLMGRDRTLGGTHREALDIIARSGEHLLGLINDVLSIAKIEAGRATLAEQKFDLLQLVRSVREMMRIRADTKGLRMELHLDPELPVVVVGDEGKLRQVLVNLLGNAVKFTERGTVTLRVRWQPAPPEREVGRASFEVTDTGYGMTGPEVSRLFEAFVQTESGRRAQEGTGLGLVISRDLVRLMGGDVQVESTPGVGSTFRFDVVLRVASYVDRRVEPRRTAIALAPGEPAWRILVADDVAANRLLLVRLLEPLGFEVRQAANGKEVLAEYATFCPNLVFMDMGMPVMDGLEATRRIREAGGDCKIVALTASAFPQDRDRFLAQGCDDYVPKPFQTTRILTKLTQQLGVRYVYEEAEPEGRADRDPSARLTAERLARLPGDLVSRLRKTLEAGDTMAALEMIGPIRQEDPALADDVEACVRNYRFEEILEATEESGPA